MSGEDVVSTLGLDDSAYLRGLGRARDEMGRFTKAVVDMDTRAGRAWKASEAGIGGLSSKVRTLRPAMVDVAAATGRAAGGMKDMQAQASQLMRLSATLGPELGGLVAMAGRVQGTRASGIGGATMAMGAFGIALGVVYKVGSTVTEVLSDVAAHAQQIEDARLGGLITQDDVANITAAGIAYENLWTPFDDLQILLTSKVSPAVVEFGIGLEFVSAIARGFSLEEATQQAQDFYDKVNGLNTLSGAVPDWMKQNGQSNHMVTADEQKAKDAAKASAETAARAAADAALKAAQAESVAIANTWIFLMDSLDAEAAATAKSEADTWAWLGDQIDAENRARTDTAIAEMNREHEVFVSLAEKRVKDEQAAQEAIKAARQQQFDSTIQGAQYLAATLTTIATAATQAQVDATEEGTAAHRMALYNQGVASKAAAVTQAAINVPVAVSQALASAPPPANIALGVLAGVAAGAELIAVSAVPVKYHGGGLAPDEQYGMPQPITRKNERTAVLTAEGQRHIDADDIDRANSGAGFGGQTLQIIVRSNDGRRMSGRQFARTDPGVGFARRGRR